MLKALEFNAACHNGSSRFVFSHPPQISAPQPRLPLPSPDIDLSARFQERAGPEFYFSILGVTSVSASYGATTAVPTLLLDHVSPLTTLCRLLLNPHVF